MNLRYTDLRPSINRDILCGLSQRLNQASHHAEANCLPHLDSVHFCASQESIPCAFEDRTGNVASFRVID
jgi:hypothetical protein